MGTLNEDLSAIKEVEDKIIANKVARFAYTDEAYTTNDANGVTEYNVNKEQNIPTADASVLKVNETVLSKGYRAQASSVTRMLLNHFFGRMSYNLNKVNDIVSNLIATLIGHRGTANGFATLDENGRIPYSQLPESAMEYKGQWNAETNTPTLADGTGTKGDFYIVSVGGTQNLGSGNIQFSANDRIIYDGSVWARLSAGAVQTVNNISPENGNVTLTGENIPVSSTDPTLLSAPLTTDRYADNSITNAKIKDPISVAKGGTGVTTQADINKAFINNLDVGNSDVTDGTEFISSYASDSGFSSTDEGSLHTPYKRQFIKVWNYIKGKISSVLGLTATNYGGTALNAINAEQATRAATAGIADKTVNDITIDIPFVQETGEYVIPLGNILEPTSTEIDSPYNWDITGFFSIIRHVGHNGAHLWFEAGHGYSHDWTTYAYLDKLEFRDVTTSIKAFQYEGKWWLGLYIKVLNQGYFSKMTITFSNGLPATPTCILYNSISNGIANEEIYNSIQDIPSSWWKTRTIDNPTTFNRNITAPVIQATTNFTGNLTGNATNAYSGMVHTCSTASGTKNKTVSVPGFTLTQGACIRVKFLFGNDVTFPTLDVNDTGAHQIVGSRGSLNELVESNSDVTTRSGLGVASWDTGTVLDLYYDGHSWEVIGDPIVKRFYDGTSNLHKNVSIIGNVQTSILY